MWYLRFKFEGNMKIICRQINIFKEKATNSWERPTSRLKFQLPITKNRVYFKRGYKHQIEKYRQKTQPTFSLKTVGLNYVKNLIAWKEKWYNVIIPNVKKINLGGPNGLLAGSSCKWPLKTQPQLRRYVDHGEYILIVENCNYIL